MSRRTKQSSGNLQQQIALPLDDSPDINVRVSRRAKHASLKVTPLGKVEVVIPRNFAHSRVPAFVAMHHQWLCETLEKVSHFRSAELNQAMPSQIHLAALEQNWHVFYGEAICGDFEERRSTCGQRRLVVAAQCSTQVRVILGRWLSGKAKQALSPWLQQVSSETGLPYAKLTVRAQKTRWGSCSHRKNINLNRALLFLPADLVRYLMIHELCHTKHLNHSEAYWRLVAQWAPQYKKHERALNRYSNLIPVWAYPD